MHLSFLQIPLTMPSGGRRPGEWPPNFGRRDQRYLSNTASFVVCAVSGVNDHHNLQNYSPLLKKTCVRQVVLDKWFPLRTLKPSSRRLREELPEALRPAWREGGL